MFDQDSHVTKSIEEIVGTYPKRNRVELVSVNDLAHLHQILDKDACDVLIIDINNDYCQSSIELVQRLALVHTSMQVIYISESDKFHAQVYRTAHTGFILKPVKPIELYEALDRALNNIARTLEKPFVITAQSKDRVIYPQQIRYAESNRRIITLYLGTKPIQFYGQLTKLVTQLPQYFVQSHKSFVVNMRYISELDQQEIILTTGEQVPMSQKRRKEVREAFTEYVGRSLRLGSDTR